MQIEGETHMHRETKHKLTQKVKGTCTGRQGNRHSDAQA